MTTSNLTVSGTATLPSATSTTLGGVLVDSTASGLLAMTDGHIAVKYSTGLQIDGGGHLVVDPNISNLNNYLNLQNGGDVVSHVGVFYPSSSINIEMNATSTGAFLEFNVPEPSASASGIIFGDNSFQNTAFTTNALYSLNGVVHNSDTLTTTSLSSGDTCYLTANANLQIVQLSSGSYTGTMPIVFPTPDKDGYFFEIVMINGPGTYSVTGTGIDGSTPATIFFEFGSSAYEKGGFRYKTSTNTWYQVS